MAPYANMYAFTILVFIIIDVTPCDVQDGKFRFLIRGTFDSQNVTGYAFSIFLESPPNSEAICIYFNTAILCYINVVSYPLTEKK